MSIHVIDRETIHRCLDLRSCVALIRDAMMALSRGETSNLPRQIVPLGNGNAFGVMQGSLGDNAVFGAKLVSVFPENFANGLQSHQGVVVLFDPASGAPVAILHAGEITAIRTAAASAVATDALAHPGPTNLAVLGYGEQAEAHVRAIAVVRRLSGVTVWGRDRTKREAFANRIAAELGVSCTAADSVKDAVARADVICTTTAASEPILKGEWVAAGAHVNVVGSSRAGPAEIDTELVARSRFFADHRPSVIMQGAEFINAKAAGRIDDDHILGEIGDVLSGRIVGRQSGRDVTVYKSLGHIVQDLASAWHVYKATLTSGDIVTVPF